MIILRTQQCIYFNSLFMAEGLFKTVETILPSLQYLILLAFWKQELQLQSQGPISHDRRIFQVLEGLYLSIYGLIADPAAKRYQPGVVAVRFPVGRDDW